MAPHPAPSHATANVCTRTTPSLHKESSKAAVVQFVSVNPDWSASMGGSVITPMEGRRHTGCAGRVPKVPSPVPVSPHSHAVNNALGDTIAKSAHKAVDKPVPKNLQEEPAGTRVPLVKGGEGDRDGEGARAGLVVGVTVAADTPPLKSSSTATITTRDDVVRGPRSRPPEGKHGPRGTIRAATDRQ